MRLLPARLARLTRDFAIIFVRESFLAAATTAAIAAAGASTVAAAVTAAAPTAATWSARSAAGFGFRAGLIYFQIAAADVFAVERRDGFRRFGVVGHFDETEAARAAGLAIGGYVHAGELAEGLKESAKIFCGGLKAHVADKEILHGDSPEQSTTVASAKTQRKPKTEAAFVQRKETGPRGAGAPNTLKETRKDCKPRRAEDPF
jgi:hypothetical protein